MPTSIENYIFTELPRRLVLDTSIPIGSSLTEGWLLVATGVGIQAITVDPATLGFEPVITQGTAGQYYRGDKTWADLDAAAVGAIAAIEKGQALGVATLDAEGYVQLSQMNPAVIERVVVVADEAARYALTTAQVQNGDVVNQQLDGNNDPVPSMWYVVDQTNLDNASGYLPFSSGVAASVAWSGISGKPAIIGDLENISIASEGDLIQYDGDNWVNVSIATLKASLALEIADINSLQDDLDGKQSQSDVLDNLSNISTTGLIVRNSDGLFIGRELVGINGITVTEPKGDADNPSIGLSETGVVADTYGSDFEYPVLQVDEYGRSTSINTSPLNRNPIQIQDVSSTVLQANTEHILGNGITSYSSNLSLELPDNVPGGTWVKIKCGQDFVEVQGSITINAPSGKTVQGASSFPFSSYFKLYPFSTLDLVYSSSTSNWTVFSNAASFSSHLYVARQGATNGPSNSHLIRSSATSPRTLDIPDRDVDLSSVGQTDFLDANFRISDDGDPSKKVAFSVGAITAGETRVITVPDSNVDLGLVGQTDFVDNVFRVSDSSDATKKIAFQASGIATDQVRTITMPNADVDLGKIPTNLSLDGATAVLTQTLADSTSLSADLSVIAVNQVALTGGPTVTVTGTQSSTKYFLAGSTVSTFDVTAFTNTGKFIEIVNNRGFYTTITLTATDRNFRDEANDLITFPVILVRGESLVVFPVNATTLQVYRNKPDVRNIKNNSNTVISGFKTTNLFVDSSTTVGQISASGDELVRIFALAQATLSFGYPVYDARTDTQISAGSYTMYAGQVIEVTKTSATKWVVLGGHIQDTSMFRLYNSSNVPTKFDTSAATAERTITMPDRNVNLGNVAQAASTSTNGYLTSTDWNTFNNKNNKNVRIIRVSTQNYTVTTANADGNTSIYIEYTGTGNPTITIPSDLTNPITIFNFSFPKDLNITWSGSYPIGGMGTTSPSIIPGFDGIRVYPYRYDGTQYYQVEWVNRTKYSSNMFLIHDYNDITKNIRFNTSAIGSGQLRIITMPDADVNLGKVAQAASGTSDGYLSSTAWNTFNNKLGLADVRYVFLDDSTTTLNTYTVPASAVTAVGRTVIELSSSILGSITVNAATGTGKSIGDSVNICITAAYNAQVLVGSGATLQGDLTFSYQHQTKTLIYKGSNVWRVVG